MLRSGMPLFALAALAGFCGAAGLSPAPRPETPRAARSVEPEIQLDSHRLHELIGNELPLEIVRDLRPQFRLHGPDAALRFSVVSRLSEDAAFRYAIELVDELGEALAPPETSRVLEVPAGASVEAEVPLPSGMGAGFYLCRITAVAVTGAEGANALLEVGLAVHDGTVHILSDEEWYAHSVANRES